MNTWISLALVQYQSSVCLPKEVMFATLRRMDSWVNLAFLGGVPRSGGSYPVVVKPGYLAGCYQGRCLETPYLHDLAGNLRCRKGRTFGVAPSSAIHIRSL